MSYIQRFFDSQEKARAANIANRILDLMDKLRLSNDHNLHRRWIWELLQNAKDVCQDEDGVSILVNLDNVGTATYLDFKHDGAPFSVDNLIFLIEQVSTKDREHKEDEVHKITGRFGTGFLTTHLLSEKVIVKGVLKDPDLPYRQFNLLLDRSGRTQEDVLKSVSAAVQKLKDLDTQADYEGYDPKSLNTQFRYILDDEGREVMHSGLNDLQLCLPYTLVFNPLIKSLRIAHTNTLFTRGPIESLSENARIVHIYKERDGVKEDITVLLMLGDRVSIAREIVKQNDEISIVPFHRGLPKLFCDFPLIGTEGFHLPVVVNSSLFYPTEPRNGVFLGEQKDERVSENKSILQEAVELIIQLLNLASEKQWRKTAYLADVRTPEVRDWFSKSWFEESVQRPIRDVLIYLPLVETLDGKRNAIRNRQDDKGVWFPYHSKKEVRERIWRLANSWIPNSLPIEEELHAWYDVVWEKCYKLDLTVISNSIQGFKDISGIIEKTKIENDKEVIHWLNEYYDLINFEGDFINHIINDKYAVIPNQLGVLCKRTALYIDKGIEHELKNVLKILGEDPRSYLRFEGVVTKSNYNSDGLAILYYERDQDFAINEINRILLKGNNPNAAEAISYISSLFSEDPNFPKYREPFYDFSKRILGDEIPEKKYIQNWDEKIWEVSDKSRLIRLASEVSKQKKLSGLTEHLRFQDNIETLEWLDRFIQFLIQLNRSELLNSREAPILPNQDGDFCLKDDLFLDDGEIDEGLKDVAESLGYNCRKELLDKNIFLELPVNRVKNKQHIATEITQHIRPRLAEVPRSEETRKIFKSLFIWFNQNRNDAELIFDELYKNRHRLYDDEEIAENMKKAEMLDEILSEHGISLDEFMRLVKGRSLKEIIREIEKDKKESDLRKAPADIQMALIQLGITAPEELLRALQDRRIANQFEYISSGEVSGEMFEYVMKLIERSKENVKLFLEKQQDYDITKWTEQSKTVITGVLKFGRPVTIVVRPSDGGQVIFYYGAEKDALERTESELWVDNGYDTPQHLTLGKIIKRNNIQRIGV